MSTNLYEILTAQKKKERNAARKEKPIRIAQKKTEKELAKEAKRQKEEKLEPYANIISILGRSNIIEKLEINNLVMSGKTYEIKKENNSITISCSDGRNLKVSIILAKKRQYAANEDFLGYYYESRVELEYLLPNNNKVVKDGKIFSTDHETYFWFTNITSSKLNESLKEAKCVINNEYYLNANNEISYSVYDKQEIIGEVKETDNGMEFIPRENVYNYLSKYQFILQKIDLDEIKETKRLKKELENKYVFDEELPELVNQLSSEIDKEMKREQELEDEMLNIYEGFPESKQKALRRVLKNKEYYISSN